MDALVVTDKMSSRSRGFGFVTMSSSEEGSSAISALDGTQVDGRNLTVNEARPREEAVSGARFRAPHDTPSLLRGRLFFITRCAVRDRTANEGSLFQHGSQSGVSRSAAVSCILSSLEAFTVCL